ncbi:unnamed protein product [Auanema sp. JU1783]|nr:unnamed protein product [Auanema sp. JU1783]
MNRVGVFGQISEINDHLFLSGAGVLKPEKIRMKKITFVVNATTEEPNAYIQGVDYLKIRVDDHPSARLGDYFDQVADKIKNIKERGGKTLVHCMAGVSRSASLVMVYLVKHEKMSLRQAYHYVKSARPVIRPNVGFWKQMVDYERKVRGTTSVSMVQTPQCDLPIPDLYCEDLKRLCLNSSPSLLRGPPISYSPRSYVSSPSSTTKRRGFSASSLRPSLSSTPSSLTTTRRSTSPAASPLAMTSYSLFSPAPSRKPRNSLFSIYSNSPRHAFFSAF